jgi:hypothetical protein
MKKPAPLGGTGTKAQTKYSKAFLPAPHIERKRHRLIGPIWIEAIARRRRYLVPLWRRQAIPIVISPERTS